jgi:EAL domain-containing protein (putative c-di-GMP-specific phosphodiesterase class I)
LLARMGCAEGQGYHFGRPVPANDIERNYFRHSSHGWLAAG